MVTPIVWYLVVVLSVYKGGGPAVIPMQDESHCLSGILNAQEKRVDALNSQSRYEIESAYCVSSAGEIKP